jgi:hypothetical protein
MIYMHTSILLSIAQEEWNQCIEEAKENNLAHLLEHTPGLKMLNVVEQVGPGTIGFGDAQCCGTSGPRNNWLLTTHTHPCMLKLQMGCSLCDARMQKQVIRARIVRMPCSLTTSAWGRSGGDHKAV